MKAIDICPRWKWDSPEEIIERLLAESARTVGAALKAPAARTHRDQYYTAARRVIVRTKTRQVMREKR